MGKKSKRRRNSTPRSEKRSTLESLGSIRGVDLIQLGGGYISNDSGVSVTPETSQGSSAVNACVRVISEDLAGLPKHIFERQGRNRSKATYHPLYHLIHTEPNDEMSSFVFFELAVRSLLLHGNFYAWIEKEEARVINLWPLDPVKVKPFRRNGQLYYSVWTEKGYETLTPDRILHVVGPSDDGINGKSVIEHAANCIGVHLAADKLAAKYFANGTMLGGYLTHPGQLSESAAKNLKSSFIGVATGVDNAHGVGILQEGMVYTPLGIKANEAQFLESRRFQVEDIARLFRVSPIKIGHLDKSTNNNIEELGIDHVRSTLRPHVIKFEQEINRKLFWEEERQTYYCEFDLNGLQRGDQKSRYEAYAIGRQWGWLSVNQINEWENLDYVGPAGDVRLSPLNMIPAEQIGEERQSRAVNLVPLETFLPEPPQQETPETREEPEPQPEPHLDITPLIREATQRLLRKEINACKRAWKKHQNNPEGFLSWAEDFYQTHRNLADEIFRPIGETTGKDLDTFADEHVDKSLSDLREAVASPDQTVAINTVLENWETRHNEN